MEEHSELASEFVLAVSRGDETTAQRIWSIDSSLLDEHFSNGIDSLLESAVSEGDLTAAKILVNLGANPHASVIDGEPENILYRAAREGSLSSVEYFLDLGVALNHTYKGVNRCLALTTAVRKGHVEVVKRLISAGANVNFVWYYQSPLSVAERHGHTEIADALRQAGAKLLVDEIPEEPSTSQKTIQEEVIEGFGELFGSVDDNALFNITESDVPISIHAVPPNEKHPCVTLFTTGLSEHVMNVPEGMEQYSRAELYIQLPADWKYREQQDDHWNWPHYWLRTIARYPLSNDTWLGAPATLFANDDPPKPIALNCQFTTFLLAPDADWITIGGESIKFYRLVPLFSDERQLEIDEGLEALMLAMDREAVPRVVDMNRRSAAH